MDDWFKFDRFIGRVLDVLFGIGLFCVVIAISIWVSK